MSNIKVLIACEESQTVCKAFRGRGIETYSCDIVECSGGKPEWHIQKDVLKVINGMCGFYTMDGKTHYIDCEWDLVIAHPPCTYLTVTGNRWFNEERYGQSAINRYKNRIEAIKFFLDIVACNAKRLCIENPIGIMSGAYRKPNQIIHPYMFGHNTRKSTCLWLRNLPELTPTNIVEPKIIKYKNGKGSDDEWHMNTIGLPEEERRKQRSKTFEGIAQAMAEQWKDIIEK